MTNHIMLCASLSILLGWASPAAAQAAVAAPYAAVPGRPLANRPVVNGRHIQPRADTAAAPGQPDISDQEARALDELYRRQMDQMPGAAGSR